MFGFSFAHNPDFLKKTETAKTSPEVAKQIEKKIETTNGDINTSPSPPSPPPTEQPKLFKIISIVDGDTVKVEINGKIEPVRLIGIDTPETNKQPIDCFGNEAASKAREFLGGKMIRLENDPTQGDRDKYNRLLRYIYLEDGTLFNKEMIEEGFAREYTYKTAYQYQADFKEAELDAKKSKKGLWGSCTAVSKQTAIDNPTENQNPIQNEVKNENASLPGNETGNTIEKTAESTPPPVHDPSCQVKGNISATGEKIYHIPGGSFYGRTTIDESAGERWFCTEAEATAAGWRKSKS